MWLTSGSVLEYSKCELILNTVECHNQMAVPTLIVDVKRDDKNNIMDNSYRKASAHQGNGAI